jgi:hypothetical protein
MTKRFVILLDTCAKEEEEAVRAHIVAVAGWWHWLPNSWLLSDPTGQLTARKLRDDINKILPETHMMVLEFSDSGYTWSGFGPSSKERDMFNWMNETWGTK